MTTLIAAWEERFRTLENSDATLLRTYDGRLTETNVSEAEFQSRVRGLAQSLREKGIERGDHVFLSLASITELTAHFWALLWIGAVPCALFPDHGVEAVAARFSAGAADYAITDRDAGPIHDAAESYGKLRRIIQANELRVSGAPTNLEPAELCADDPAFMVFTSGSTGFPKAVVHRHSIAAPILRSMTQILGVRPGETFWCTAHPAWITGSVYAIIGPILRGAVAVQYSGAFHAKRWLPLLEKANVSTLYTAPSALRGLMRMDDEFFQGFDLSALRAVFSVGEPLTGAIYSWGRRALKKTIYDTWFQSEAGTIRIANLPGDEILPDWMGKAVDDSDVVLLDEKYQPLAPDTAGVVGKLALRRGWASAFSGYFGREDLTASKFNGDFYLTGDLAKRDETGRYQFIGRDDDLINTSGHLLGPFEVESVLCADSAVQDAAVVSVPDPLTFEAVAAFLVLKDGIDWDETLELRLRTAVSGAIAVYAAPKLFVVVSELPRNDAGKILRRELRDRLREGTA